MASQVSNQKFLQMVKPYMIHVPYGTKKLYSNQDQVDVQYKDQTHRNWSRERQNCHYIYLFLNLMIF